MAFQALAENAMNMKIEESQAPTSECIGGTRQGKNYLFQAVADTNENDVSFQKDVA